MISKLWIYPLITSVVLLIITISCKKDDDDIPNPTIPVLITAEVIEITHATAKCVGIITSNGGDSIIARGVCWDTIPTPLESGSKTIDDTGVRSYTSSITGLTANTTYYVRAYATNSAGIGYGAAISFTTAEIPTDPVTDYDGNIYQTIKIGNQIWMAENMKTTHYADGTPLIYGTDSNNVCYDYDTKYWFVYDDTIINKDTYGLLYTWAAATKNAGYSDSNPSGIQGVCPTGWHLPSNNEWQQLIAEVGEEDAAKKIMADDPELWYVDIEGVTNESGFSAIAGGRRICNSNDYYDIKIFANYISTSFCDNCKTCLNPGQSLYSVVGAGFTIRKDCVPRSNAYSVRCVKD